VDICVLPSFSYDVGNNINWGISTWYFLPVLYIFLSCGITEPQNSWDWKGSLVAIWSKPLFKQGHPGCPRPCSDSFWISPRYAHPHGNGSVTWCLGGTSCVSVCAHCLLSCHWAPLKRVCLHPLCTLPSGICVHWWDPLWAFSSSGWTAPTLSAFPNMRGAPGP